MDERRAVPRVVPASNLVAKVKGRYCARVVDISSRGARLELCASMVPDGIVDIRLQLDDGEIALRGRICRCRAVGFRNDGAGQRVLCYSCGVAFDEAYPEDMARLTQRVLYEATVSPVEPDKSKQVALVEN